MKNSITRHNVTEMVYVAVYWALYRAADVAVYGTVHWAVEGAVGRAVQDAASQGAWAQPEEPPHPGLALYLGGVP